MANFTINGSATSWSQCEVSLAIGGTLRLPTITDISYKKDIDREYVFGAGQDPIALTEGVIKYDECKIVIGVPDWQALFASIGGELGLRTQSFSIAVSYKTGIASPIYVDTLSGCRHTSIAQKPKQGASAIMCDWSFKPLRIDLGSPGLSSIVGL